MAGKKEKIGIVGSRSFDDYELLKSVLDEYPPFTVVSGGAEGTDTLVERYADEKGYGKLIFPALWKKYGKKAGPIRNKQIVNESDQIIAFWDGTSKGAQNIIGYAQRKGVPARIIRFQSNDKT